MTSGGSQGNGQGGPSTTSAWTAGTVVAAHELLRPGTVICGADGRIAAVEEGRRPGAADLGPDAVIAPGAVDLHGDAVEKMVEPRPGVRIPFAIALDALDRRLAGAGITTAYAAISCASEELGLRNSEAAAGLVTALRAIRGRVDHRVHLRVEITSPGAVEAATAMLAAGGIDLASLMDHTPGQGQFATLEDYVAFHMATYQRSLEEVRAQAMAKLAMAEDAPGLAGQLARVAADAGTVLAWHDPDGPAAVDAAAALGAVIAEFPTSAEAAAAAHARGLAVAMGAPNLLRRRSSSGNACAADILAAGHLDLVVSDYYPEATWPAVFAAGLHPLDATRLVATTPAAVVGLHDRGTLRPGARADLVALDPTGRVLFAMVGGRRVA